MKFRLLIVMVLVAAACGASEEGTSSERDQAPAAPSSTTTTTEAPTTTTGAPTTTAADSTTTTTPDDGVFGLMAVAEEKVASVRAVIPADYMVETVQDEDGVDNELFESCLDEDDFDLADIDDVTVIAYDITLEAPVEGVFGSAEGNIEVRMFEDAAIAEEAFGTLATVLGTDEGRACVSQQFADELAADLGEGATVTIEFAPSELPGDVGTSLIVDIDSELIDGLLFFELVASLDGPCAVYSVFTSFDEPFDTDLATALLTAATAAA